MKLNRREALVGAVAAAVAPKLPIPAVAAPAYVNPWAETLAMSDVYEVLIASMARQIETAENETILEALEERFGE